VLVHLGSIHAARNVPAPKGLFIIEIAVVTLDKMAFIELFGDLKLLYH